MYIIWVHAGSPSTRVTSIIDPTHIRGTGLLSCLATIYLVFVNSSISYYLKSSQLWLCMRWLGASNNIFSPGERAVPHGSSCNAEGSRTHPWCPQLSKSHSVNPQICYQCGWFWVKRPRFHFLSLWVFFKFDTNFGACKTTDDGVNIVLHMLRMSEKAIRCLNEFMKQGAMIKPSVVNHVSGQTGFAFIHFVELRSSCFALTKSAELQHLGTKALAFKIKAPGFLYKNGTTIYHRRAQAISNWSHIILE